MGQIQIIYGYGAVRKHIEFVSCNVTKFNYYSMCPVLLMRAYCCCHLCCHQMSSSRIQWPNNKGEKTRTKHIFYHQLENISRIARNSYFHLEVKFSFHGMCSLTSLRCSKFITLSNFEEIFSRIRVKNVKSNT